MSMPIPRRPEALITLLREDVRLAISPQVGEWNGREQVAAALRGGMNSLGAWRLLPTVANGHPAAVRYVRRLNETTFLPFVISVLDIQDGRLTEIAAFEAAHLVTAFGLPTSLGPPDAEHPSTASLDILGPSLAPEAPSDRSSCGT